MLHKPNRLIHSTSPYLLQHAHNPVDWFEWGPEASQKAMQEDKPILVSIGYSSCHWCHVMERECFEVDDIANIMNEFFVCIKVDREERPDIDQIYMESVQAMGINGGWPLNVFLTPDQKPFYGGTYFPPPTWAQVLTNIHKAYQERRTDIESSAEDLKQHLSRNDIERFKQSAVDSELKDDLETIYKNLEQRFDTTRGGLDKSPKFVMPSIWRWLLRYYHLTKNEKALQQTHLTLKRVAMGGIYDQVGGGFARYSVDGEWFAPHFEKMLYDNAQLLSLYSEAYAITQDEEFKTVINETFEWLQHEMTSTEDGFYSALDADSEGTEGKFYVWKQNELNQVLGEYAELTSSYYSVKKEGNWEHGENILIKKRLEEVFLKENNLSEKEWRSILLTSKKKLLEVRKKRVHPGLDDKVITSWNALMVCGLVDAHKALSNEKFLQAAKKNMLFLERELWDGTTIYRSHKNKRSTVKGFLDDYAYAIQAQIKLYQVTFDEQWIKKAERLMNHALENFFDAADGYFHYAGKDSEKLIASKKEIFDNVIPSSNSVMAQNLFHLSIIFDREDWKKIARNMVDSLGQLIKTEPNYMSNWAIAYTEIKKGMAEVEFIGNSIAELRKEFHQLYEPFAITMGTESKSALPLLEGKEAIHGKSTIYVCFNKTCKLPVHSVSEALKQLQ